MTKIPYLLGSLFALTAGTAAMAAPAPNLTTEQIIERNVAARGGLDAWRAVKTLTMSGELDAGGKKNVELPFVVKMKRPYKSRLEIRFQDKTALQIYDGVQGWKYRPFLGREEVEPYSPAETKEAASWAGLDGPLIDYQAKGTQVALEGGDTLDGSPAYKLKLTLRDGEVRHLWVDANTFLERKIEGEPRRLDGKMHSVAIFYRDYRPEKGLAVPHVFETVVDGVRQTRRMTIDRVSVNQAIDDALFARPQLAADSISVQ